MRVGSVNLRSLSEQNLRSLSERSETKRPEPTGSL
jgi:hypothetical protein